MTTIQVKAYVDSQEWKNEMKNCGSTLKENKVRLVICVHGTFVGDDPFGLFYIFEERFKFCSPIINWLKKKSKLFIDGTLGDIGNYTDEYVRKFSEGIENNVCKIDWGGGNFHEARLLGAIDLARKIAEKIKEQDIGSDERVLLLGHSHAGQVFALLTTFLEDGPKARQLNQFIEENYEDRKNKDLRNNLEIIKHVWLDLVTFGTPVRYTWGNYSKFRLLPVINHRSNSKFSGVLTTRDGDYVQQWGVEGTDAIPLNEQKEKKLAEILADVAGPNIIAFNTSLLDKSRRQPKYINGKLVSKNELIDYKDNVMIPNPIDSIKNIFGHGAYTKIDTMAFNIQLVVNKLY